MSAKELLSNLYHAAAELLISRDSNQAYQCAVCMVAIDYIESTCLELV